MNDLERLHQRLRGVDDYRDLGWIGLIVADEIVPGAFRQDTYHVSWRCNALGMVLEMTEGNGERFQIPISWSGAIQHRHGPDGRVLAEVPLNEH